MARTTKIGLWSIPWFPAFVVFFVVYASRHPTYESWMRMRLNADGTTAIEHGPALPLHLPFEAGLRIVCWVSAAAFIVGLSLLLLSLGRLMLRKRASAV